MSKLKPLTLALSTVLFGSALAVYAQTTVKESPQDAAKHIPMAQVAAQIGQKNKTVLFYPKYDAALNQQLEQAADDAQMAIEIVAEDEEQAENLYNNLKNQEIEVTHRIDSRILAVASAKALKSQDVLNHKDILHVALAANYQVPNPTDFQAEDAASDKPTVLADTVTTWQMLQQLSVKETGNVLVSPYSLSQAGLAAMLATQQPQHLKRPDWFLPQIQDQTAIQHLKLLAPSDVLQSWNTVWYQTGRQLNPDFVKNYQRLLAGQTEALDFGHPKTAANKINSTIAKQTQQRITHLLTESNLKQAEAVLTNVVYFKANWQTPFNAEKTRDLPFKNADKKSVQIPTLREKLPLNSAMVDGWTLIELPFANGKTTLTLILPPEHAKTYSPSADVYQKLLEGRSFQAMNLELPKIKLEGAKINLEKILPKLASWQLEQLFEGQVLKNLQGIHQASIEWDETGAEAAAATAMVAKRSMATEPTVRFNRPFSFLIQENGQVLFAGIIQQLQDKQAAKDK